MTIYSLDVLLFLFGTSLLFHLQFFLTCMQISQEAGQVIWYSHLFQNFPQFIVVHTVHWKGSVLIPIPKKGNDKECSNYCTIALISHAGKVMLKIFRARLQQYMDDELPDVEAGFRKRRGTRDQIANICWIIEKQGNSRKPSTSASLTTLNLWLCESQQIVENSSREGNTRLLPVSWEICMQVKKQASEPDMEQWTSSK